MRPLNGFHRITRQGNVRSIEAHEELRGRETLFRSGDHEFEAKILSSPHPGAGHIIVAVADKNDLLPAPSTQLLADREEVGKNLTRMLIISQSINCRNSGKVGKINNILLRKSPNHRTMDHAAKDSCGILNRFTPTKLNIIFGKKHDSPTKFTNPNLKGNTSPGRSLRKNDRPSLARKWLRSMVATSRLQINSEVDQEFKLLGTGFFNG